MASDKSFSTFRGATLKLKATYACKSLPEELNGLSPSEFRCDRWQPYTAADKAMSNEFLEKNFAWVKTANDKVIYGLERWGALIPNDYTEWFSVVVLRPALLPPSDALVFAAMATPIGQSRE